MSDKLKCPKCKSEKITKIVYGKFDGSSDTFQRIKSGEVKLGGMCLIAGKSPSFRCQDCGFGWGELKGGSC